MDLLVLSRAPGQAGAEEWRPLALQVAEFQASTPARFHVTPRGQYMGPPLPPPLPAGQLTDAQARILLRYSLISGDGVILV